MKKKKRDTDIDMLRGLGILIVILGHVIQANLKVGENSLFWENIILSFQMPLLFFVSGMTMVFSVPNEDSTSFIKKKIGRILIPYIAWVYLHYLIVCCIQNDYRVFSLTGMLNEFFKSDFWFLRYLFCFILIVSFCNATSNNLIKKCKIDKRILLCGLLTIFIPIVEMLTRVSLFGLCMRTWYYIWFVIGYAVCILTHNNIYIKKRIVSRLDSHIAGAITVVALAISYIVSIYSYVPEKIICILWIIGGWIISYRLLHFQDKIMNWLINIGSNTLPIYAIHWCLLFSPLWRINFYTRAFNNVPLAIRCAVTGIVWIVICGAAIPFMRKNKYIKCIFLGESL